MELECAIEEDRVDAGDPPASATRSAAAHLLEPYPFAIEETDGALIFDWRPMIRAIVAEGGAASHISARFHNTLVIAGVEIARHVGEPRVVLTGGCFQNKYLTERFIAELRAASFTPYWHQRVPPNDGGIALGQIIAAASARK